ncbi:hypothetical protein PTTG_29289 [Puccinia triticina 1-1 BBBD Race 1]|uniref:PWWP domain-containing protein n=1 Tax=Puccinia triticina (isolate 1-1 / race 1 (BBBD)) TaxID=630390 RepID=A0A180G583_PUCT1|nr:hypothetical protein PTTG_29289 [Puccinia triticina 1-1 BBBD Race 1]
MSFTGFETLTDGVEVVRIACQRRHPEHQTIISISAESDSSVNSPDSTTIDAPDDDLNIPGEPILCKSNARGKYWPASVISYAGLRNKNRVDAAPLSEKRYLVEFCDGMRSEVPRSYFFTPREIEFHTVQMGDIQTTEIQYDEFFPKIKQVLPDMDAIFAGNASDDDVKQRHENFLTLPDQRPMVRPIFGGYSDSLVCKASKFLRTRYFDETSPLIESVDPQVLQLSDKCKTDYISDIALPEVFLLVTVKEVIRGASRPLMNPRQTAMACLMKTDIVDLVTSLRIDPKRLLKRLEAHQ